MRFRFLAMLSLAPAILTVISQASAAQPADIVASDSVGNTAMGTSALAGITSGKNNTAAGFGALTSAGTAHYDTALGSGALHAMINGQFNTAVGYDALLHSVSGNCNTALGDETLTADGNTRCNTALGYTALQLNTSGAGNVGVRAVALNANTTGSSNTAVGASCMKANTTGSENTAIRNTSLSSNTIANTLIDSISGSECDAVGSGAMIGNTTGYECVSLGANTLPKSATGAKNYAIGSGAGSAITGIRNIDIGTPGVAGDNSAMRIGGSAQTAVYVAGIYGTPVTGSALFVSPTGQLGVVPSSVRFKTAIAPMGSESDMLESLRPVSFQFKGDASHKRQFGLIAEEVAKVYPNLAIRDQHGRIDGVRYDELGPLLINEYQKDHRQLSVQASAIAQNERELAGLKRKAAALAAEIEAVER